MKKKENKLQSRRKSQTRKGLSLENLGYWDITDPSFSANYIVSDNFYFKENISRVMLSGFYMEYKKTINKLHQRLNEKQKSQILEPLSVIMNQNENRFYNSYVNLMVSNEQELEKLGSAIQTSVMFLSPKKLKGYELEESFIKVCDSVLHFFDRLNVYRLIPSWSFGVRFGEETIQRWVQPPEDYTFEHRLPKSLLIPFTTI